jgi:hypothetical protein
MDLERGVMLKLRPSLSDMLKMAMPHSTLHRSP